MERSLRRANAPLAFSEGFNPHPKLSFASALPVGATGLREYLDVELADRVHVAGFSRALAKAFPPALAFVAAEEIMDGAKSLSAVVNLAVYRIAVSVALEDAEKVAAGVAAVLAADELWRKPKEKPGKKPSPAKEVRGLVQRIEIIESAPGESAPGILTIEMELLMQADGQLRPQELWEMIAAAGNIEAGTPSSVCRTALLIRQGGKVFSPMEGGA